MHLVLPVVGGEGAVRAYGAPASPMPKFASQIIGGEGGIRTLGTALQPYIGLANRRTRPLCDLSKILNTGLF